MSRISVQCKGSGQASGASFNSKKAVCGHCQKSVPVMASGKMRKHMRQTTTAQVRRGKVR